MATGNAGQSTEPKASNASNVTPEVEPPSATTGVAPGGATTEVPSKPSLKTDVAALAELIETINKREGGRRNWEVILGTWGLVLGIVGLVLGLSSLWRAEVIADKLTETQNCIQSFPALEALNGAWGYGQCTLVLPSEINASLPRMKNVLTLAESCPDNARPDTEKLGYYQAIVRDSEPEPPLFGQLPSLLEWAKFLPFCLSHATVPRQLLVCEEVSDGGPRSIWLRTYCLSQAINRLGWRSVDAPAWMTLSDDFTSLTSDSRGQVAADLKGCGALTRMMAYHNAAAATPKPADSEKALAASMAAMDSVGPAGQASIARLIGWDVAAYGLDPVPDLSDEEREQATEAIALGLEIDADYPTWQPILDRAHVELSVAAMGAAVVNRSRARNEGPAEKEEFDGDFATLVEYLDDAGQADAHQYLDSEREEINGTWFKRRVADALRRCREGSASERRQAAQTLQRLRTIFGWWASADVPDVEIARIDRSRYEWLFWWEPAHEKAAHDCSLGAGLPRLSNAKDRVP